jgi:signal transduction histidine kinase/CheY-like chemotaxis protein
MVWMVSTLLLSLLRAHHALSFQHAQDAEAPHWRRGLVVYTLAYAVVWGMAVWMLPLQGRTDLQAIVLGSMAAMGASGTLMLTADKRAAGLWLWPVLVPGVAYCLSLGSDYGLFGTVTLLGFGSLLWVEAVRGHRRLGELLALRFQSDHIAEARAQALNEAEQLQEAKGHFLAAMGHEMRTPLHGILGLSRMLRSELQTQEAHQRLNLLQGAGQHLLNVINDVLDHARLQSGQLELAERQVALHELVRDAAAVAEVAAVDKGLTVEFDNCLPEGVWVEADGDRIRQVLGNLLSNAVKFTERGQITVRLRQGFTEPGGVKSWFNLEVQDTGIGMVPSETTRIFEAFQQLDASHRRKNPGSGLGLSIARQVCEAMGGELVCDSQWGEGTLFRCVLPLKVVPAPVLAVPPTAMGTLNTWPAPAEPRSPLHGTVLLVEDNPINAMVAQAELEQLGLVVAMAENGRQALEWLALHEADLVLMDCQMPEMDGFEATRHIRSVEQHKGGERLPIIALTAAAQVEDQRACLEAGMDDHLAKPFHQGDLVKVIRRHLLRGGRRTARALMGQGARMRATA